TYKQVVIADFYIILRTPATIARDIGTAIIRAAPANIVVRSVVTVVTVAPEATQRTVVVKVPVPNPVTVPISPPQAIT
ncbi:hypothetical protein AB2B41_23795, partial [Marimonas sp. MJW-29]